MDISNIYVHDGTHDGTLHRVLEEPDYARIIMDVELPVRERNDQLEPRHLIFEDVYSYSVVEGYINGCSTLLDLTVVGKEGRWTRLRLDTTVGYREILCGSLNVVPSNLPA